MKNDLRGLFSAWICLLLSLVILSPPLFAKEVTGLYQAEVLVMGQSKGERVDAARVAFTEILVKVSGNRAVTSHPQLGPALLQPMKYVQQFHYRDIPKIEEEVGEDLDDERGEEITKKGDTAKKPSPYNQLILIKFEPKSVNQLLIDAGLPIWGKTRPAILLWLAVEDSEKRYLVGTDIENELPELVKQEANRRGLPLILPLLDLEDRSKLRFADVWGDFQNAIINASARYSVNVILVGRIYLESGGDWQGRWSLYQRDTIEQATIDHAKLPQILAAGINLAADSLSEKYAQIFSDEGDQLIQVNVTNVNSIDEYARTMRYLDSLDMVSELQVAEVSNDSVSFQVYIRGTRKGLIDTIGFGDTLAPLSLMDSDEDFNKDKKSKDQDAIISYRLIP